MIYLFDKWQENMSSKLWAHLGAYKYMQKISLHATFDNICFFIDITFSDIDRLFQIPSMHIRFEKAFSSKRTYTDLFMENKLVWKCLLLTPTTVYKAESVCFSDWTPSTNVVGKQTIEEQQKNLIKKGTLRWYSYNAIRNHMLLSFMVL